MSVWHLEKGESDWKKTQNSNKEREELNLESVSTLQKSQNQKERCCWEGTIVIFDLSRSVNLIF